MKATLKTLCVLIVLLLATVSTTGLAQSDDKKTDSKENNKTQPSKESNKTAELTITKAGAGEATIISSPAGIHCGDNCRASFRTKSSVTLTAVVAAGSAFKSWSGDCKGIATICTVTMKEAQNVIAKTARLPITLNVTKTGTGTGSVTSLPAGIDCGTVCSATFPKKKHTDADSSRDKTPSEQHDDKSKRDDKNDHDDEDDDNPSPKPAVVVTLTATPATGSVFTGWSGACTGTEPTCTVSLDQTQNVGAGFAPMQVMLNAAITGTGAGTIASLQSGIDCGTACSAGYDWSTPVTLTAIPATGSAFTGWSGACTGTADTCTVTLDHIQNVSAGFAPLQLPLTVAKTGTGSGTVASAPAGIDCGPTCSGSYDWSTAVTLTATAAAGSTFTGWSGACSGTATRCTVTLDQAQSVSAGFAPAFKTLSLAKTGSGAGTVTSSPAGIDCGTTCSADFASNSIIILSAVPATSSAFGGWFGACSGSATTCSITLDQAKSVTAGFSAPAVTTYQYDANGNLTQITDPLGRIRQIQYDALNRPISQLEPHPSQIGSTLGQIDTGYDSLNQIKTIIDPRNLTTTYTTDSLGNLSQQTSPDTGISTAGHDEAGNLKIRTDARGKTAAYRYDSLNRISQIVYDDQTVNYTWDSCANGIGRLCSVANNNSTISYRYDSHGRLTGKTQSAGTTPLTVSHSYNAAGQRTTSLSPGGQSIEYQWVGNHINAILINGQALLTQITYEPDGQVNGWLWGNNQRHERFHDLNGKIAIVSLGFDPNSQQAASRYYSYDAAGRLTNTVDDSDPSLNQRHDYDQLDRLTGSERGESQISRTDYHYDLSGNRSGKITGNTALASYQTEPNSNRLQSQSGTETVNYSYDPAGNLTGDGNFNHSYNAAGRRIASTNTAIRQTTSYSYDAFGRRITKTVNGNTFQYVYDEQGHLTGEYAGSGQLIQEIVWLGDLPVAVLKPAANLSAPTADLYYIHADHLGTPRVITRPSDNQVVWRWESEAFGNSLPEQNPSGLGNFVFNLRFPGQYYDSETGLHYNMARYYNPRIGRYETSDPIGLIGGINTYGYVQSNPLNITDPFGLDAIYINYDYYPVTTPFGKLPLGHGAVVSVDPSSGDTKYYEFGRYGDDNGVVRSGKIPNVSFGEDGLLTEDSLDHLYDFLSHNFGHDVHVTGTYYPNSDYKGTINFAEKFKQQHPKYDLFDNNCKTFSKAAATACQEGASCK